MVRLAPIMLLALALASSHVARADVPAATSPAPAASPAVTEVHGQRWVGVGAEIGVNTGLGPALHLGTPQFGLYVASGILPLVVVGNEQNATRSVTFDVYRAFAVNADLYAMLLKTSSRAEVGIAGGYSGNTVLGNGVNLGIVVRYDLGEKLAFTLFGGLEIFPDGRDHLVANGYPTTRDAVNPQIQGGANIGLVLYP
ncbi:MAG TPA: hypothetical protein VF469_23075 [Kofleriaceae bacterium]